jgi:hypothetical protein
LRRGDPLDEARLSEKTAEVITLLGLRTAIYHTPDIAAASSGTRKSWGSRRTSISLSTWASTSVASSGSSRQILKNPRSARTGASRHRADAARLLELGAEPRTDIGCGRGYPRSRRARSIRQCVRHHRKPELRCLS